MLAEELHMLDTTVPSWAAVQPLLDSARLLEMNDDTYSWHGWKKKQLNAFLQSLPAHCVLLVGVWETTEGENVLEHEVLHLGCVCEVVEGEIRSVRTFEALTTAGLPSVVQLEPAYEDALAIMRAARSAIAPVAWALFTDKATWDAWLFGENDDKGELLASFARQGRCVLMGSQTAHHQR